MYIFKLQAVIEQTQRRNYKRAKLIIQSMSLSLKELLHSIGVIAALFFWIRITFATLVKN